MDASKTYYQGKHRMDELANITGDILPRLIIEYKHPYQYQTIAEISFYEGKHFSDDVWDELS